MWMSFLLDSFGIGSSEACESVDSSMADKDVDLPLADLGVPDSPLDAYESDTEPVLVVTVSCGSVDEFRRLSRVGIVWRREGSCSLESGNSWLRCTVPVLDFSGVFERPLSAENTCFKRGRCKEWSGARSGRVRRG